MQLLFCGDVVGQSGRKAMYATVKRARRELGVDFVVANGENAAGGYGITPDICKEFFDAGVDVVTTGLFGHQGVRDLVLDVARRDAFEPLLRGLFAQLFDIVLGVSW